VLEADGVGYLEFLQGREYDAGGGESLKKRYGIGGIGFLDIDFDEDAAVHVGVHGASSVFAASFGDDFGGGFSGRRAVGENAVESGLKVRPLHFFGGDGVGVEGGEAVAATGDLDGLAACNPSGNAGEIVAEVGDGGGSHNV